MSRPSRCNAMKMCEYCERNGLYTSWWSYSHRVLQWPQFILKLMWQSKCKFNLVAKLLNSLIHVCCVCSGFAGGVSGGSGSGRGRHLRENSSGQTHLACHLPRRVININNCYHETYRIIRCAISYHIAHLGSKPRSDLICTSTTTHSTLLEKNKKTPSIHFATKDLIQ